MQMIDYNLILYHEELSINFNFNYIPLNLT